MALWRPNQGSSCWWRPSFLSRLQSHWVFNLIPTTNNLTFCEGSVSCVSSLPSILKENSDKILVTCIFETTGIQVKYLCNFRIAMFFAVSHKATYQIFQKATIHLFFLCFLKTAYGLSVQIKLKQLCFYFYFTSKKD